MNTMEYVFGILYSPSRLVILEVATAQNAEYAGYFPEGEAEEGASGFGEQRVANFEAQYDG